ncbi:hypothetical protein B0H15DRAFT_160824 [Mycena belliarum]|uniref:Uncharacterized protein n=1 Tax=Mycena belliarum TaxID=1033014 RepID=A0AAD6TKN8_9AGAR|nr:hypothetical protein B0H15DRAFT_160824 [Mycena belliae]
MPLTLARPCSWLSDPPTKPRTHQAQPRGDRRPPQCAALRGSGAPRPPLATPTRDSNAAPIGKGALQDSGERERRFGPPAPRRLRLPCASPGVPMKAAAALPAQPRPASTASTRRARPPRRPHSLIPVPRTQLRPRIVRRPGHAALTRLSTTRRHSLGHPPG